MKKFIASLFSLFLLIPVYAQFGVSNIDLLAKAKKDTTYVRMDFSQIPFHMYNDVITVYSKYWTVTPLKFVSYNDFKNYYKKDNASFITINTFTRDNLIYTALDFWMLDDKAATKKKAGNADFKPLEFSKKIINYPLYYYPYTSYGYSSGEFVDFYDMGANVAHDFSLGILKNMLQQINDALIAGKEFKPNRPDFVNSAELSKLKTETLYIPDWTFLNGFLGQKFPEKDIKAVLQDYSYKYEIIKNPELSTKIMTSSTPFYYLKYHRDGYYFFLSVINSATGEAVYFTGPLKSSIQLHLERKEIKALAKAIEKS